MTNGHAESRKGFCMKQSERFAVRGGWMKSILLLFFSCLPCLGSDSRILDFMQMEKSDSSELGAVMPAEVPAIGYLCCSSAATLREANDKILYQRETLSAV